MVPARGTSIRHVQDFACRPSFALLGQSSGRGGVDLAVNNISPLLVQRGTSGSQVPIVGLCSATALLQVTVEDFEVVCKGLYRALCIREKNMQQSLQRFPRTPSQYLRSIEGEVWSASDTGPGTSRCLEGCPCPLPSLEEHVGVCSWYNLTAFSFWSSVHPASEGWTGSL